MKTRQKSTPIKNIHNRFICAFRSKNNEDEPLGLILCAQKKEEHIELLELNKSGIHVAEYLTELPSKEILEMRLRNAMNIAQRKH